MDSKQMQEEVRMGLCEARSYSVRLRMRAAVWMSALGLLGCTTEHTSSRDGELGVVSAPLSYREQSQIASVDTGFTSFGTRLSVDGATALVADPSDGPGALAQSGTVSVFVRAGSVWTLQQTLTPSVRHAYGSFGVGLTLVGDTAYIGEAGVGVSSPAVFVWQRADGQWSEGQKLVPTAAPVGSAFGESIALEGDLAVIGAPADNQAGDTAGAAYLFTRDAGVWTEAQKIVPSDATAGLEFGWDVKIDGDTVVIGAPSDDPYTTSSPGRAYVYQRNGGSWVEQRLPFTNGFADDAAGTAVGVAGDAVVVGAPANGHKLVDRAGSVHVFRRQGASFIPAEVLAASDATPADSFGAALALQDGHLVVGAPDADGAAPNAGAVYDFAPTDAGFVDASILPVAGLPGDTGLGESLGASGTTLLVGTHNLYSGVVYAFSLLGATCDGDASCETGVCVDGVCCEQACDGPCETCAAPGQEGLCTPVAANTPDALCDAYVCGDAGACKTGCVSTFDCRTGDACNASGVCVPIPTSHDELSTTAFGCAVSSSDDRGDLIWCVIALVWATRRRR